MKDQVRLNAIVLQQQFSARADSQRSRATDFTASPSPFRRSTVDRLPLSFTDQAKGTASTAWGAVPLHQHLHRQRPNVRAAVDFLSVVDFLAIVKPPR
jgi:hypothetical protein